MNDNNKKQLKKTGRRPKEDPATIRYTISFNEQEHARFLALFDKSGMQVKAHFITSCIFDKTIKTIQIDKGTVDFYMRLTSFHSQFRSIGVNYNQIVKLLYKNFSEKKAAAFLYKLEKQTAEMAMLCQKIIQLTEKFEEEYYTAVDNCLGSQVDTMIERGYDSVDIIEREKHEKYLSEYADMLGYLCEKRNIKLWGDK